MFRSTANALVLAGLLVLVSCAGAVLLRLAGLALPARRLRARPGTSAREQGQ